jgi:hypothetical protein
MSNLWYGFDNSNQTFTPLPASPWLIPATLIYFIVGAVFFAVKKQPKDIRLPMAILYSNSYKWKELKAIAAERELTPIERQELARLEFAHGGPWPLDYSKL